MHKHYFRGWIVFTLNSLYVPSRENSLEGERERKGKRERVRQTENENGLPIATLEEKIVVAVTQGESRVYLMRRVSIARFQSISSLPLS